MAAHKSHRHTVVRTTMAGNHSCMQLERTRTVRAQCGRYTPSAENHLWEEVRIGGRVVDEARNVALQFCIHHILCLRPEFVMIALLLCPPVLLQLRGRTQSIKRLADNRELKLVGVVRSCDCFVNRLW